MVSGSSALPIASFEKWREITGHTLLERFGMTEIGMALTNPYEDVNGRLPGFVGHPFPGVEAALLDLETNEIHHDQDREGELLIKSNCMFSRYYNNEQATSGSFIPDGQGGQWFKTGDCVVKSSQNNGAYKILGRLSLDIIKHKGYKLSGLEIENALASHPQVRESAVIGVPHPDYGEEVVAYVVLKDGVNAQTARGDLGAFAKDVLSDYKVPKLFNFIEKLPRNQMGKIDKKSLKAQH